MLDDGDPAQLGQPLVGVGLAGLVRLGGVLEPGDRLVLAAGREQGLGVGVEEPGRPGPAPAGLQLGALQQQQPRPRAGPGPAGRRRPR